MFVGLFVSQFNDARRGHRYKLLTSMPV